jgi:GH35 family endo-1,4-beta-xylanase
VVRWWGEKVKQIYALIPDFGGFLVKANSEGQPGPQDYGRSHADGANMMADIVKPYGGIILWRAFVYDAKDKDRARQAYMEFTPLDGKFHANVIVQVKNGPVDFQPREPFSPLFGGMTKTALAPEFQVTQEYLGQSTHLVFLGPMWEECLKSDTYERGAGSTVARCTDGSIFPHRYTAIAGVSNVGLDVNWCGHPFAQANWYAFGRLAWNDRLTSDQIAEEWLRLTFLATAADWVTNFLAPVKAMMLQSREAAVNYMMPLGLHHLFSANEHYGPGPWWAPKRVRQDWTPPYYHKADSMGIGFERTSTGSNAVSQYNEPLRANFAGLSTCPDIYLLWFHHVSWDYRMRSGRTLWEELCYHYDRGVQQVKGFQAVWDKVRPYVDAERFELVQSKLRSQSANAQLWKDACLLYFQQFSKRPIPANIERPVHDLDDIIREDTTRRFPRRATAAVPGLKDVFQNDFLIGTALNLQQIQGRDPRADTLIRRQFNTATPENIMKSALIHPGWDTYQFGPADQLVEYARSNGMQVNAHTLIWHSQLPGFVRNIKDADSLRKFFVGHITTVAGRYDGKVASWDVVNEALNEDGTLRNTIFLQKLGPDYIVEAFRLAQKAAPHTELCYNDYNIESPAKRTGAIEIVKKIKAAGVRIDAIGIQGHWHLGSVPFAHIAESIDAFAGLGIKVNFTELDISVLPNPLRGNTADVSAGVSGGASGNPWPDGLPDSVQDKLAADYAALFKLFLEHKSQIGRVTFWGVEDGGSWLNDWPVRGRTNYPLLFDRNYAPKKAFYSVIGQARKMN